VFAYLEQCVYFEPCGLLNTDDSGNPQLAVSFYDICDNDRFWSWEYVKQVLGEDKLTPNKGSPYYRVGYCPAYLDEDGGFIKLGSLLFPGYRQTPEYGLLMASSLPQAEKDKLADLAVKQDTNTLRATNDLSAVKWFHENTVPQVIQTSETIYCTLPKQEFKITSIITK
jgi:hypothetical protein